jgi:hypothetical protein
MLFVGGDLNGLFVGDLVGLFVGDVVELHVGGMGDLVGLFVGDLVGVGGASHTMRQFTNKKES